MAGLFTIDGEPVFAVTTSKVDYSDRLKRLLAEWNVELRGPLMETSPCGD